MERGELLPTPETIKAACGESPFRLIQVSGSKGSKIIELTPYSPEYAELTRYENGYTLNTQLREFENEGQQFVALLETIQVPGSEPSGYFWVMTRSDFASPQNANLHPLLQVELAYLQIVQAAINSLHQAK